MGTNIYPSSALLGQTTNNSLPTDDLIEKADGFASVTPDHKYKIVKSLQSRKHICGVIGNGLNDMPVLKQADIGITIASAEATDAALKASDIVFAKAGPRDVIAAVMTCREIIQSLKHYSAASFLIYSISISISTVLVFTLLALKWKFDFPPFIALIIAILNEVTAITMSISDLREPSALPERRILAEAFTTGMVLANTWAAKSRENSSLCKLQETCHSHIFSSEHFKSGPHICDTI